MSELKPCPFCGNPPQLSAGSTPDHGAVTCKCVSPSKHRRTWIDTKVWNTRTAQITPQAGEAEPAYYAVVDEEGDVIELTKDKQYAHDFINDAIASAMEQDITLANRWVVRPLYRTAPPRPVGPTAGDILISRDAAMTVLARWVYDEHWMKASDDMLAVATTPSPVAPVWQPIETAPRDGTEVLLLFPDGCKHIGLWGIWRDSSYPAIWQNQYGDALVRPWTEYDKEPTHWQPLPSPPDSPGAEGINRE